TVYGRFAGRYVGRMIRDREGTIWVTNGIGRTWMLCAIQRQSIPCYGEDGGRGVAAIGLHEGRDGTLWGGTIDGVWRWRPGEPRFYPIGLRRSGFQGFYDGDDGSLCVVTETSVKRLADGHIEDVVPFPAPVAAANPRGGVRDRDGGGWFAAGGGLVHVRGGIVDVLGKADGLSGDFTNSFLEDREGNVWVSTSGGLDRFSDVAGAVVSGRQGLTSELVDSVLASRDGSIWAATAAGLQRLGARAATFDQMRGAAAMFEDRGGRIWAGGDNGMGFVRDGRFVDVTGLPGGRTRSIVEDRSYVWIVKQEQGLVRVSPDVLRVEHVEWHQPDVTAATADPTKDGMWV